MKKTIIFLMIVSSLSFSKDIIGYTRYIDEKDLEKLKIVDNPKEYLEDKYKGLYDVEDMGSELKIYPKVQFIKVNSKVRNKEAILNSLPSIYLGRTIKDFETLVSEKNSFMLKDQDNVYLYVRANIDDDGRYGILIDEYIEKDIDVLFDVDIINTSTEISSKLKLNNFRDNDYISFNTSVSLEDKLKFDTRLKYEVSNYKRYEKYGFETGTSSSEHFYFKFKYDKYLLGEDKGDYKYDLKVGTSAKYIYNKSHAMDVKINYEYNLRKNGFKFLNKGHWTYRQNIVDSENNLIIGNNVLLNWESQYQKVIIDTNLAFSVKSNKDRIKSRNVRTLDKYLIGDFIIDNKFEWDTLDIVGTRLYMFNDFAYAKKFDDNDRKYSLGFGIGAKNKYIKNFEMNTYAGVGFNNKKIGFVGGLGVSLKR